MEKLKKKYKRKKGYTLIELLAVIIIFAIISLIAFPIILNIVEKSRKNAFLDSAYGIVESAKSYYLINIMDNKILEDKVFSFDEEKNELQYKGEKPKGGNIIVKSNGKIEMVIHNKRWCVIKQEEDEKITIIDYDKETCKIETPMIVEGSSDTTEITLGLDSAIPGNYYNIKNKKGTITCVNLSDENKEVKNTSELKVGKNDVNCSMTYENKLITSLTRTFNIKKNEKEPTDIMIDENAGSNGTIKEDTSGNPRYAGSNPNNYVCFGTDETKCSGNQQWRIIGIIDGNLKLVSPIYYSIARVWDSNNSNDWVKPTTLNVELENAVYNNTAWIKSDNQKGWITNNRWKLGGVDSNYTVENFEAAEKNSSYITSNHIGLMTITDFAYASSDNKCELSTNLNNNNSCFNDNWLTPTIHYEWTMTRFENTLNSVWHLHVPSKIIYHNNAWWATPGSRPVVILDSTVKIKSGTGTISDPYILTK